MTDAENTRRLQVERSNKKLGLFLGFVVAVFFFGFMFRMIAHG